MFAGSCGGSSEAPLTHSLAWEQDPGTETLKCYTFKLDNAAPVEISRIRFQFGAGSHHVHIYRTAMTVPDGVQDCWNGVDWTQWQFLAGAQTTPLDWSLPDRLTMPLDAHQQLQVQVHWLNGSAVPVNPQIDFTFFTASSSTAHVGVTFGVNKQVAMRPGQSKTVSHWCPLPSRARLVAMMGHYHALGRSYTVALRDAEQTAGPLIYEAQDENTLLFKQYLPTMSIPDGVGLDFTCDYLNFRDIPITWGADTTKQEHCNMAAYYYPADPDYNYCIKELDDLPPLASLSAAASHVSAGETTDVTVQTSTPVETDTDVTLAAADATALDLPGLVTIPAGQSAATFSVRGLRPADATQVTATLGTSTQQQSIAVSGLFLSEVLAAPMPASGGQWIEVANTTGVPIDLSLYTVGAGHMSYSEIQIPLGSVLPPYGCLVLGQPSPLGAALPSGTDQSGGIALFSMDGGAGAAGALPLDALVYGADNPGGMVDAAGVAASPIPAANPGSSLGRQSNGVWSAQLVPTPDICQMVVGS